MADLDFIKVIGRLGETVVDGPVDPDEFPDIQWADSGEVWITPLITTTRVIGADPVPATLGQKTIKATIDADGYLSLRGNKQIWVVDLTSSKVNPHIPPGKATHFVQFIGIKSGDDDIQFDDFNARFAPDTVDPESGACDITIVGPVAVVAGVAITRGEKGETGDQGVQGIQGDQGIQGIQGVKGDTGQTGSVWLGGAGAPANSLGKVTDWYLNTTNDDVYEKTGVSAWTLRGNIKGSTGTTGATGRGITTIARTSGTGAPGTTDTYTITYSDASTSTFTVYNGATGSQGIQGVKGDTGLTGNTGAPGRSVSTITRTSGSGAPGTTDTFTITYSDSTTSTFTVYNGANGATGTTGPAGRGVVSLARTSGTGAPGTSDTYTITYSDATTTTFTIYNGLNGSGAGDVTGAAASTDNAAVRFDLNTGKLIQNSLVIIDDAGKITTPGGAQIGDPTGVTAATVLTTNTADMTSNTIINAFTAKGALAVGGTVQGLQFFVDDTGGNNSNSLNGVNGVAQKSGAGTITSLIGVNASTRLVAGSSPTATTMSGIRVQNRYPVGTTAVTVISFEVAAATAGGAVTSAYGLKIAAQKVTGVTSGYGVAADGTTDLNYFMGSVGIGTAAPGQKLDVVGNIAVSGTVDGRDLSIDGAALDGLVIGTTVQAYDADLAAIAALAGQTTFGRDFLTLADASAARVKLNMAANFQPLDSDLTSIAALSTTTFGRSLLTQANAGAAITTLGLAAVATSGSASDITTGTLPNSVLPPLAITVPFAAASQTAMLALTAQQGDVAIRSDLNKSFILSTNNPGTLGDWLELLTPTNAVLSVNSQTGVVVLTKSDVGLSNVANSAQVDLTSVQTVAGVKTFTSAPVVTTTVTGASGTAAALALNLTVNQSGTAGYSGLLVNAIETTVGSGTKRLLEVQVGGASRFRVNSVGTWATTHPVGTPTAFAIGLDGDTQNRLYVDPDGKHSWGPGGTTAIDTYLYRSGVAALKTDGLLETGGLIVTSVAPTFKGGAADSLYMQFYRDAAAQTTRSAWMGYGSAGVSQFTLTNEIANGSVVIAANGTGVVNLQGTQIQANGVQIEPAARSYITQTGNYTLVLADAIKVIYLFSSSAFAVTIPPDSSVNFPIGTYIEFFNGNTGDVQLLAGSGVALWSPAGLYIRDQYATAGIRKIAANIWTVMGRTSV